MCLFQLVYQFWLYPRLGPPLGRFSHLQMFRLGCSMYIPSYFALPLLRAFASPDKSGGVFIMTRECIACCDKGHFMAEEDGIPGRNEADKQSARSSRPSGTAAVRLHTLPSWSSS